jgi:hypothetical protein
MPTGLYNPSSEVESIVGIQFGILSPEEIQKGSKLKTVSIEDTKATKTQATGGLLGMLAMEMSKRRINMNVNESESDSDSGFSSSSDSEDD